MTLLDQLRSALGADGVLTGEDIGAAAAGDMSGTGGKPPLALIRPRSTE